MLSLVLTYTVLCCALLRDVLCRAVLPVLCSDRAVPCLAAASSAV